MDVRTLAAGCLEALGEGITSTRGGPLRTVDRMIDEPVADLAGQPGERSLVGCEPDRDLRAQWWSEAPMKVDQSWLTCVPTYRSSSPVWLLATTMRITSIASRMCSIGRPYGIP